MSTATAEAVTVAGWTRDAIAGRAARDVPDGAYVNLGIGMPMLIPDHVPADREVWFHTENGILGLGGPPAEGEVDLDVTNAGKEYATVVPGASAFDSALSFAIVRGGHLDVAALGAMEVAPSGDLSNWAAPGRTPGVGGAMDLVVGAKNVWVLMDHVDRRGRPKLVARTSLPLTGAQCVTRVYTSLGVFRPAGNQFECLELAPGVGEEQVRESTGAPVVFVLDGADASEVAR